MKMRNRIYKLCATFIHVMAGKSTICTPFVVLIVAFVYQAIRFKYIKFSAS